MGPRIDHRIWNVVVRKIGIGGTAVERELQHLHAWKTELLTQCDNIRGNEPEVFNDERELPQRALHGIKDGATWALLPSAGRGGGAKMVDAQQVDLPEGGANAISPPGIAGLGIALPVVDRISPELALGSEGVRRNAGDHGRSPMAIQP